MDGGCSTPGGGSSEVRKAKAIIVCSASTQAASSISRSPSKSHHPSWMLEIQQGMHSWHQLASTILYPNLGPSSSPASHDRMPATSTCIVPCMPSSSTWHGCSSHAATRHTCGGNQEQHQSKAVLLAGHAAARYATHKAHPRPCTVLWFR